jgi:hypothetical protein
MLYGALSTISWVILVLSGILSHYSTTFQFSNFYSRCYCNSSATGLGARAYSSILFHAEDLSAMEGAWIAGTPLAAASVAVCVIFVNLFINPELPGPRPE